MTAPLDKPRSLLSLVLTLSVAVIVGAEVFGIAIATAWAAGGLFHLGSTFTYAIGAALVGLGLWVMVPFTRNVWRVERTIVEAPVRTEAELRGG
ncbi:hypothetical protein [Salinarimonas sp.]|uniref:hypothetical protein n=1 Tax=Salinarimonas sp. TaxID=2766526 RepID=UPI00391C49C3